MSPTCGFCLHFRNDAAYLERSLPGLASMGSGHGATRGDDGICARHDLYLGRRASCADFTPPPGSPPGSAH